MEVGLVVEAFSRASQKVPNPSITKVQSLTVLIPTDEAACASSSFSASGLKMMRMGLALRIS
jgi:hypothetical protein